MAKLIYAAMTSLDGYVVDEQGIFEWLNRMRRVHASINDLRRSVGAYVYGRRMYETMAGESTPPSPPSRR
jgi:dihydrofolate reductase